MGAAWSLTDSELARQRLELLEGQLDRSWPDAAASLREGVDETLTLMAARDLGTARQDALLHQPHPHCPMKQLARFRSTQCDPFGIPSTSHWTGAAIIVQWSRTKTCIVTRLRNLDQADALRFGRVTYEMMEAAWRPPARQGARPEARTCPPPLRCIVNSGSPAKFHDDRDILGKSFWGWRASHPHNSRASAGYPKGFIPASPRKPACEAGLLMSRF
jgi:hypothetical protein